MKCSHSRRSFQSQNMLDGRERPGELQHEDITVLIPHYNRAEILRIWTGA